MSGKLFIKRAFVRMVERSLSLSAKLFNFGKRIIEVAENYGLDRQRAWDVKRAPGQEVIEPFGAHEFLIAMDRIAGPQSAGDEKPRNISTSMVIPVLNKVD